MADGATSFQVNLMRSHPPTLFGVEIVTSTPRCSVPSNNHHHQERPPNPPRVACFAIAAECLWSRRRGAEASSDLTVREGDYASSLSSLALSGQETHSERRASCFALARSAGRQRSQIFLQSLGRDEHLENGAVPYLHPHYVVQVEGRELRSPTARWTA